MRGLPFPSTTQYDRELSYEYGTPLNAVSDIPIDPALGGPAIDPAIIDEGSSHFQEQVGRFLFDAL